MRSRIRRLPPLLRWWGAAAVAVLGLGALLSAVVAPGVGILLVGAAVVPAAGWWTGTACRRRRVRARLERLAEDAIRAEAARGIRACERWLSRQSRRG